jgi:hypothetical protein
MSDKQRQKKDGRDTNKANQRARKRPGAAVPRQHAVSPSAARDTSNLTDSQPGASDRTRRRVPKPSPAGKTRSAGLSRQALASSSPRLARSRAGKTGSGKGR